MMLNAERGRTLYQAVLAVRPVRVLLADDDREVRRSLAMKLRRDGYQVSEFADGDALLADLRAAPRFAALAPPDVLVCDLDMPGLSGFDLLAALRCRAVAARVILTSASDDLATRAQAAPLHPVALLRKPLDVDDLRTLILRLAHDRL